MYSIWSALSSRESTARFMPRSAHSFTPSREWTVIWVEAWTGRSGATCFTARSTPRSWTSTASAPISLARRASSAAGVSSRSVSRVFRVR